MIQRRGFEANVQKRPVESVFPAYPHHSYIPRFVGLAHVGILVPATVGVMGATQAVVVAAVAHEEVHLTHSHIR